MNWGSAVAFIALVVCLSTIFTTAIKAWSKRNPGKTPVDENVEKRLARLEVAIDDLTTEIGRMNEGQQFLTKALTDRPRELVEAPHERQ